MSWKRGGRFPEEGTPTGFSVAQATGDLGKALPVDRVEGRPSEQDCRRLLLEQEQRNTRPCGRAEVLTASRVLAGLALPTIMTSWRRGPTSSSVQRPPPSPCSFVFLAHTCVHTPTTHTRRSPRPGTWQAAGPPAPADFQSHHGAKARPAQTLSVPRGSPRDRLCPARMMGEAPTAAIRHLWKSL